MNFVSNNGLSMLGGDDLSSINQSIIDLDASVVHKTGYQTETINGLKTFTSNLVVNNANTTITATGTATDGLITLTATDPTSSGLYGQVQAYADTKIQLKMNASNSQVVMTPSSVSIIGDTTDTTTKNTETHNIGELASLTSGTFNVTDLVTTKTLLTMNDTYVKLQAPNFGSQLDIAGSLCHFDGVPSGTNALYFGSIEPFNTIGFINTNLQFLNTDIGITQDATNTSGRSIGISVLSSCVGDILFSLQKRTSSSFLTASGFRFVRENATSNYLFQRRNVSSGGIGTNTTIQTITFDGATETFTAPTQNKVASTAFNVTDGTTTHLSITPTQTTETNVGITLTATNSTAGAMRIESTNAAGGVQLRAGTNGIDLLSSGSASNYMGTGAGGANRIQVNSVDKINTGDTLTTITNTNIDLVGQVNATSYATGTNTARTPLLTYFIWGQRTIQNQAISAGTTYNMWLGNNSVTATCNFISVPNISLVTQRCCVWFDNGTFTGGGTVTAVFNLVSSGGGIFSTSGAFTIVSGSTALASLAMPSSFTPGVNGVLQVWVVITNTVAITASTKNMYCQIWCSQK